MWSNDSFISVSQFAILTAMEKLNEIFLGLADEACNSGQVPAAPSVDISIVLELNIPIGSLDVDLENIPTPDWAADPEPANWLDNLLGIGPYQGPIELTRLEETPGTCDLLFGPDHDYGATCTDLVDLSPPPVVDSAKKLVLATAELDRLTARRDELQIEVDALLQAQRAAGPPPPCRIVSAIRRDRGRGRRRSASKLRQPGAAAPTPRPNILAVAPRMRPPSPIRHELSPLGKPSPPQREPGGARNYRLQPIIATPEDDIAPEAAISWMDVDTPTPSWVLKRRGRRLYRSFDYENNLI